MSLHNITDTMIKTAEINAETIAAQDRTIHNLTVDLREARQMVDGLRAELATSDTWHASYCRVQTENNDLKEMLATEIAASTALRTELAAANAKVAELTETCAKFAEALYLREAQ